MIIVTTFMTDITTITTILMHVKSAPGIYIGSGGIALTLTGIARRSGSGRLIGIGATIIPMNSVIETIVETTASS